MVGRGNIKSATFCEAEKGNGALIHLIYYDRTDVIAIDTVGLTEATATDTDETVAEAVQALCTEVKRFRKAFDRHIEYDSDKLI